MTTNFIVNFCESLEFQYLHPFLLAIDVIKLGFITKKINVKNIIKQMMFFYKNINNEKILHKYENIIYSYTSILKNTVKISCFTYVDSTKKHKITTRYNIVIHLVSAPSTWCFNSNSGLCVYTTNSLFLRCEHYQQRKYRSLYFEMDNEIYEITENKIINDFKLLFKTFCKIQNLLVDQSKTININTRDFFNKIVFNDILQIKNKSELLF